MFNFDKFLESILGPLALPAPKEPLAPKPVLLPEVELSPAFLRQLDKDHLDFLARLFMTASNSISHESQDWFVQEITFYLRSCYPNISLREYELILQQIIDATKKKE